MATTTTTTTMTTTKATAMTMTTTDDDDHDDGRYCGWDGHHRMRKGSQHKNETIHNKIGKSALSSEIG